MAKRKVSPSIVCVSDIHSGCRLALFPDKVLTLDTHPFSQSVFEIRHSHTGFHDDRQVLRLPVDNRVQSGGREYDRRIHPSPDSLVSAAAPNQDR